MRLTFIALILLLLQSCIHVPTAEEQILDLQTKTGFSPQPSADNSDGMWLQKNHRGYAVLFRPQMGNVWGRYAARMAMGEIGRELGRVGQFLTGSYRSGVGGVAGSPLDRALSAVIGQPLTFYFVLKHDKAAAHRLDVVSDFSTVKPVDPEPHFARVGFNAGSIYTGDSAFGARVTADKALMERLSNLRSQYIRVDDKAVSFIFAGSERDWAAEINERDGYPALINDIVEILGSIADKIEAP